MVSVWGGATSVKMVIATATFSRKNKPNAAKCQTLSRVISTPSQANPVPLPLTHLLSLFLTLWWAT
jgi:hypothetical protein